MNILEFLFGTSKITQEEIEVEKRKIRQELADRRPPLLLWSEPTVDGKGYFSGFGKFHSNINEIKKWQERHTQK